MKKLLLIMLLLLLPLAGLAEIEIVPETETVSAGGTMRFEVQGSPGATYQYTMLRGGRELFKGEPCASATGAYRPMEPGDYTLKVTASAHGKLESAQYAFTVTALPEARLILEEDSPRAGKPLAFRAEIKGGVGGGSYAFAVMEGSLPLLSTEKADNAFFFIPAHAGAYTAYVLYTDAQGNTASAQTAFEVQPGGGVSITGNQQAFYAPGGIREWRIQAPGVWTARTEGDFLSIDRDCGAAGDALTLTVLESEGSFREGKLIISCAGQETAFPVLQAAGSGLEEEFHLEEPEPIWIDSKLSASWMNAEGSRSFFVQAMGPWKASCEENFVSIETNEDTLLLSVSPNETKEPRSAIVTLASGQAESSVFIFQPAKQTGPDVLSLSLSDTKGTAYGEPLIASVTTSSDAAFLSVSCDGWGAPLEFPASMALPAEDGLRWAIDLPLKGQGEQKLFVSARNENGKGRGREATLLVTGEAPAFTGEAAYFTPGKKEGTLTFEATAGADTIEALDAKGLPLARCSAGQARLDPWVDAKAPGRRSLWTMALGPDARPAAIRMGEMTLPVTEKAPKQQPFTLYDQFDGTWHKKPYRNSTLEHSGCAIFALSHGLQLLGYTGDEITPEALAEEYYFALVDGGTMNSTLVGHAGDDLGFKTRYNLYENPRDIAEKLEEGAVFSFAVVNGHIALITGVTEDHQKFHIMDSATSATFERIKDAEIYLQKEDGSFYPISSPAEIPGNDFYIETGAYGAGEYWLDASYIGRKGRGGRLIQPRNP